MRHYGLDKIEVASAGYLRRRKLTAVRSAALAAPEPVRADVMAEWFDD